MELLMPCELTGPVLSKSCWHKQLPMSPGPQCRLLAFKRRPHTRAPLSTDDKWLEGHHLPQFSSEVQPLLLGHPLTREEHHKLAKQFRREIIDFLNEHNLITDTSSGGRRWKYHYLGLSLAFQFPKLHWDFRGSRASHGDHSKAKAKFLSKLAEARRHQLARAKSREITAHIEPSS
ncbi:uncharacterized protein LOC119445496 isoform X1 [Dermacentor silvarum]|uniref:uncharacterized protein LOC119445496 isoform X1 n=1 Tax=Dermacentor silvarum TaxID=543639 RepID=UPI00189BF440|nr:uncharacterized protein LOC119445496 isoform X1 [Dermacentor silvarum]XP_049519296.1 uncharacterized protein LOC119445496 isoform X1 [Dermacentor silvarum]